MCGRVLTCAGCMVMRWVYGHVLACAGCMVMWWHALGVKLYTVTAGHKKAGHTQAAGIHTQACVGLGIHIFTV